MHCSFEDDQLPNGALSWFSWTAKEGLPHIFCRLNLEHKVDPGMTAVRYTASFSEPIVPRYNSHSLGWFFCDTWSWIFSERKREIAIRETTNNTVLVLVLGLIVDRATLGVNFLRVLILSPVSIITLMLRTRLSLNSTFTRRTNGRNLGTFKQSNALDREVLSCCFSAFKNTLRGYSECWKAHMEKFVASNRNSFEGVKCRCSNSLIK